MTSPNHKINSLDSEKLILTQYCATNCLRRTFMQTLYVIYSLKCFSACTTIIQPKTLKTKLIEIDNIDHCRKVLNTSQSFALKN